MNVLYLHTNPYYQEIDNLIQDVVSNMKSKDVRVFEMQYLGFSFFDVRKVIKLRRFVKSNKIDIVHTYHYVDAYYTLKACCGLGVSVVCSDYFYHDGLKRLEMMRYRYVLSHATVIFQTNVHKDYTVAKYGLDPQKHYMLLHAFSEKRLDNYRFNSVRDEFFIDDFRYLIGTAGDFTPEHDVMNVFKMVRKLRKTGRNFTCVVVGDELEEYESFYNECKYYYLIQGLDNYITYAGGRKDVVNFLSQLDAFVYHSDKEAVALPVIEAMLLGINVVVNDTDMIREITYNGKYATLYKTGDPDDFAAKTRDVLIDLEDNRMIAEVVKDECRDIFSIGKHIYGLNCIYHNVMNDK